jgi:sulfur-carrier protein
MQMHLDDGIAVAVNGEIYRDRRDQPIPSNADVFLLPRIQGG